MVRAAHLGWLLWATTLGAACSLPGTQGAPECQVFTSDESSGVPSYLAVFRRTSAGPACGEPLQPMALGVARFGRPDAGGFELALRPALTVQLALGQTQLASFDPSNDCRFPERGCGSCVRSGPANSNFCQERLDPVTRDVADGGVQRLLTLRTPLPRFPNDAGICRAQDATQRLDFVARELMLVDGGRLDVPALTVAWAWKDVQLRMTGAEPGSVLTASVERTQGSCVEAYAVRAIWPLTYCLTDVDCVPNRVEALLAGGKQLAGYPGPDGGLSVGDGGPLTYWSLSAGAIVSGVATPVDGGLRFEDGSEVSIDGRGLVLTADGGLQVAAEAARLAPSPQLQPKCEVALGVCVPTVALEAQ